VAPICSADICLAHGTLHILGSVDIAGTTSAGNSDFHIYQPANPLGMRTMTDNWNMSSTISRDSESNFLRRTHIMMHHTHEVWMQLNPTKAFKQARATHHIIISHHRLNVIACATTRVTNTLGT
jgi:hypothetical protein